MFGSKKIKKEKTKLFSSENERKRFFAKPSNSTKKKSGKSVKSSSNFKKKK